MAAWVTDVPNFLNRRVIPLQFRYLVAMQGALGVGNNLNKLSEEELAQSAQLTSFYKTIRTTVQHGQLYRLESPDTSEATEVEYVADDGSQAVLFSYLHSQYYGMAQPRIRLEGLDPKALYTLKPLDPAKYKGETTVSGAVLMGEGVLPQLVGDYDSTALVMERVR